VAVVVSPDADRAEPDERRVTKEAAVSVIVVGVDGSENSVRALRWAGEQARATGAELHAVYVWEFPYMEIVPPTLGTTLPPYDDMEAAANRKLEETLKRAQLPAGVHVEQFVVDGSPARALLDAAKGADLLVVGARGHGGFLGLLTGSVATQAVNHATVPVVVVRD
jgi:nucleotide-binding universal stress UspA family protein